MSAAGRNIARTGVLTALLLLLVPAGASAAAPSGLLEQTVAGVNEVVQSTGTTVGQVTAEVDSAVSRTLQGAQQAPRAELPVDPGRNVPANGSELGAAVERTVATTETVAAGATGVDVIATAAPAAAPRPPARARREAPRGAASPAHRSAPPAVSDLAASPGAANVSSDRGAGRSAHSPAPELPPTSDEPAGPSPAGPALNSGSGAGVASAAFSSGAAAVLLTLLFLAASALKTRLPRFDAVGRPLPLVFALERPG